MPSIEFITLRAQATRDAQTSIAAEWVWEEKTVAEWNTDLTALDTKKVAVSDLDAAQLNARSLYDNTIAQLHDVTVEGLALARVKWRKDEAKKKILSTLTAGGHSREKVQAEAQAWESVWEKFDAAWNPTPTNTIAALRTLITTSNTQEDAYNEAHTEWRKAAEELEVQVEALWADCVAWYAAATALFKAGTAIGDMIRGTIPTGSPTQPPTALEIAGVANVSGSDLLVSYTPGGGQHATTLTLQWQIVGVDPEFTHDIQAFPGGQGITTGAEVGQTVRLRTRAANSAGETFSAVVSYTFT